VCSAGIGISDDCDLRMTLINDRQHRLYIGMNRHGMDVQLIFEIAVNI
jgi:hypothetical protein